MRCVTIRLSTDIGATLSVAGPPIAGTVHVDFWLFGFDIKFGGKLQDKPKPLTIDEFYKLVLESEAGFAAPIS